MKKKLLAVLAVPMLMSSLAGCNLFNKGGKGDTELTGTAKAVAEAAKMNEEELVAAAKAEMEASNDTFKVLGLTSALKKASEQLAAKYDFLKFEDGGSDNNVYVKNDYKDYTLLTALESADKQYVADFALTQDERSIADYQKSGILHNFVPSDYAAFGITEKDTEPLKGIHFNKVFWTNTNFTKVTGETLFNIWQVAGKSTDAHHLSKVSFQSPVTEQINMSFLLSCYSEEAEARIAAAYKSFYGKDWAASGDYTSAGDQWVQEFIKNISRWHSSDGTAMKETQLKDDWNEGYVYFGAYSKMKDAAGKSYAPAGVDVAADPILAPLADADGKVNAMKTVKWDWAIEGFNGYFYTMDSQIVNNAKHPYTACLFARYLLNPDFYKATIYSSTTPNEDGTKGNQYGYYYPGDMGAFGSASAVVTNSYDWTKAQWKEKSLVEDYTYLSKVRSAKVAFIQSLIK